MTGPHLKAIREAAGLSQWKLGKILKTYQIRISLYERGIVPIPDEVSEEIAVLLPESVLRAQTVIEEQRKQDAEARKAWKVKTSEYLKAHPEVRTVQEAPPAPEVRLPATIELGPETMKALKDMIQNAVNVLAATSPVDPVYRRRAEEIRESQTEGDRLRARTQSLLNGRVIVGRGSVIDAVKISQAPRSQK